MLEKLLSRGLYHLLTTYSNLSNFIPLDINKIIQLTQFEAIDIIK